MGAFGSKAGSSGAAKHFVEKAISDHKVVVFSKSYCPYAAKAKSAMSQFLKPNQFVVFELDKRQDGEDIQNALGELTGGRTVPRVFVGGQFIGGGDDTARKAGNGELQKLLTDAGAI